MHVFKVFFLYFDENSTELYFLPRPLEYYRPTRKQPAIKFHKNYTPDDEDDGFGEIWYKTLTK